MGLAASQGRLLLLTSRKSDLEFQAQSISQERLLLSMEQERIATAYSDKINNQTFQIQVEKRDGSNEMEWKALTVANLKAWKGNSVRIYDSSTGKDVTDDYKNAKADTPDNSLYVGLETGKLFIQTLEQDEDGNDIKNSWINISVDGQSNMKRTYYTEDDAAAKADYDAAMARVQRLDKQLEVKLNQVETQHKAIETEVESVNKVIQNNIEGSFKYFS